MQKSRQLSASRKDIRAAELFCGIGGFRIACDSLGIKTAWANDVNQLSCDVYRNQFGAAQLVMGDIRILREDIPNHDLLTAGFPCQPFSSAGKKQGTRDPRGTLFEEIVKVLANHSPKWFVLENVKRLLSMENGDHLATIILALTELDYFVEWRLLNAMWFGLAQNRQRIVIVGTRMSDTNSARISLASQDDLSTVIRQDLTGLQAVDSWRPLRKHRRRFPTWGLSYKGASYACDLPRFSTATDKPCLDDVLDGNPPPEFFMDATTLKRIANSARVDKLVDGVRILYNQNGGARMGYTVFGTDGVAPALTASHSRHYERYSVGTRYRRLTNKEYAKLQGFPEEHCSIASVFDQYGLYGNAVPPAMTMWVIQQLIDNTKNALLSDMRPVDFAQMSLNL